MRLRITHRLNAHFVDATSSAVEVFDHDGVQVSISLEKPGDGTFATVTCSGMVDIRQPDIEAGGVTPASEAQMGPVVMLMWCRHPPRPKALQPPHASGLLPHPSAEIYDEAVGCGSRRVSKRTP